MVAAVVITADSPERASGDRGELTVWLELAAQIIATVFPHR